MNIEKLTDLANTFYQEFQSSSKLQDHQKEHQLRWQRAQRLLNPDDIPNLTEDDLRELFFDTDAFSFWKNKDWYFNKRLQEFGLDGFRQVIFELITRAQRGLTPEDLIHVRDMRGLGLLLSTELIAYRFPEKYWTYNTSVTLAALQILGEDIKASMPHGQKSDAYLYFAVEPFMRESCQVLEGVGFSSADLLLADIFIWWITKNVPVAPSNGDEARAIPDVDKSLIEQAMTEFDQSKRYLPEWFEWETRGNFEYAILWQSKNYPVKEIVRLATGVVKFGSGQAQTYLTNKGFNIVPLENHKLNVWMFQANPRIYDLENGLRSEKYNDWQVNRYRGEVQSGDTVVYWKAGDNRGIYGLAKLISSPYQRSDGDWVVDVEYLGHLKQPIYHDEFVDHPVLSKMHIMRSAQGTNFRITQEEWAALEPMLDDIIPPDLNAIDARKDKKTEAIPIGKLINQSLLNQGLLFTPWQIATFYTAVQTKGFVILSGISGTGKTKLAQHFASLLPYSEEEIQLSTDQISITIQPYMLKYNRVIIPKASTRFFEPPEPGETKEVLLTFNSKSETCRLVHAKYTNTDYVQLLLRGEARSWFIKSLLEGDTLFLEPQLDIDSNLTGFQMIDPKNTFGQTKSQKLSRAENWLFIPVRPDWRDSKSLLGYYNPLTGTYEWTPFLRFLIKVNQSYRNNDQLAWFIILDEMNLARVEYYFADLLSVLESGRDEDGWTKEPLRLVYPDDAEGDLPPRKLLLPPNLYIIGTVNVDETTHAFSPKVLDRAFTLELTESDFSQYLIEEDDEKLILDEQDRWRILNNFSYSGEFTHIDKQNIADYIKENEAYRDWLQSLNNLLRPHELHFGYRVFDEIITFLIAADHNHLFDKMSNEIAAFDAAVLMKVLPKFHGSRSKLEAPLRSVMAWCLDPDAPAEQAITDVLKEDEGLTTESLSQLVYKCPHTAERARRMLWSLYSTGFATFS